MDPTSAEIEFLEAVRTGSTNFTLPPGVSVDCGDESGNTALHLACYGNLPRSARRLLALGASPLNRGSRGYSSLHVAAQVGSVHLVRMLLESASGENRRAAVAMTSNTGESALHVAAFNGHTGVVRCLITEYSFDPKVRDFKGRNCLHLACLGGHADIVRLLVPRRRDLAYSLPPGPDARPFELSYAHLSGEELKCDVNSADLSGKTPAHYASEEGHEVIVRTLCECGARIDALDETRDACLHLAASRGHGGVVGALLDDCGADPQAKGAGGGTALHAASRNGHEAVVRDLLQRGFSAQARDADGRTPLHAAAGAGREGVVRALVESCPACANALDARGNTPLHLSCEEGHAEVIRILIGEGKSKTDVRNEGGITPLQAAALGAKGRAVEVLVSEFGCERSTIEPVHLLLLAERKGSGEVGNPHVSRERVLEAFGLAAVIDGYAARALMQGC